MRSLLLCLALLLSVTLAWADTETHPVTSDDAAAVRAYREGLRGLHGNNLDLAVEKLRDAVRQDPRCALAHCGLSRALAESNQLPEAAVESAEAERLAPEADDREQQMIRAWAAYLKTAAQPERERWEAQEAVRARLNRTLAIYPTDPEVWVLRGQVAESPLRAAPFFLAALRLDPSDPVRGRLPTAPPAPRVAPGPGASVAAPSPAPPLFTGLGAVSYPASTQSSQAQAYFEQGLRCFHAYVQPMRVRNSAGQCFQQAAALDPEVALAYWGLSFCDTRRSRELANRALELALKNGSDRERRLCAARVLELGGPSARAAFLDALDGAILAYPDDVELWVWRGKVAARASGPFHYGVGGTDPASIPYQLAAHRLQPEHPGPNHELIHLYEALGRPALGWPYTEGFRRSAPNMPHANHMQAHLAMRLGRWQEAISATRASRRKAEEGYPELDPAHHVEILVRALAHEGHFTEAEAEPRAYRDGLPWARLLQLKADPSALEAWARRRVERNVPEGFYIGALTLLDRGDTTGAHPLLANVEAQWRKQPANSYRHQETRGRWLVQTGQVEAGLKLLREAAAKAVKDEGLHAWGGGSYMLEVWGETALRARRLDESEEAYHEALAHEHGSIRGALGMQVVWEQRAAERTGQQAEQARRMAQHYAARAAAIWKDADAGALERQLARIRALAGPP